MMIVKPLLIILTIIFLTYHCFLFKNLKLRFDFFDIDPQPETNNLYRYYNGRDHFYSTDEKEIGTIKKGEAGKFGYVFEGIAGKIFK